MNLDQIMGNKGHFTSSTAHALQLRTSCSWAVQSVDACDTASPGEYILKTPSSALPVPSWLSSRCADKAELEIGAALPLMGLAKGAYVVLLSGQAGMHQEESHTQGQLSLSMASNHIRRGSQSRGRLDGT